MYIQFCLSVLVHLNHIADVSHFQWDLCIYEKKLKVERIFFNDVNSNHSDIYHQDFNFAPYYKKVRFIRA